MTTGRQRAENHRTDCRAFALGKTWAASAQSFLNHVIEAPRNGTKRMATAA
ncbi:MAG: hypothetical protein WA792_17460 [Pseudolabrys sp.]